MRGLVAVGNLRGPIFANGTANRADDIVQVERLADQFMDWHFADQRLERRHCHHILRGHEIPGSNKVHCG